MYKDPSRWTASFGVTINPPKMRKDLRRIIIHEKYKYPSHDYDISLAELSSPVPYTNAVHRICLPDATHEFHPGDEMFVTGFGVLQSDGYTQNHLRQVQVELIDSKICNQPQVYNGVITSTMLCAGSLKGKRDACQGDSGGPLVGSDARDIWYLAGIVSWGYECGQPNKPGVYTRVTAFRDWITSKTGCGRRPRMSATYDRIKGGSTAQKGEWPWQASLKFNGRHYCGASLISERYLVTAAHCFQRSENPKNFTVSFGTRVSPPYMQHYVQQIIIHEDYIKGEHHDDVAVILLTEKVVFTNDVHRVCLPEATEIVPPGEGVVVTGWGALTFDGEFPELLQKAPVKIIDTNACNAQEVYNGAIEDTMLCAGYMEGNIDACQGDSGGPLVHPNSRDIWYLVGIVSWGVECGKINKPGVYMRVTSYRNWIASKTGV
ncbi:Transmembrane protease serine 11B-like protein [Sciurus carolinensis]|uniref:Transmembrane protease serine 11B-like protein n=1 Tax=Sciurus carolinensis TaxID=30640 RepID=A0AA41SW19_SCICA|nr:Transmembrane protease serine 11B-like protein [Sciurus carolinensis]